MDFFEWDAARWLALGLVLAIVEVLAPGIVFIWMGIAAIIVAGIVWGFPEISWQLQLVIFGVLSLVSVVAGRLWIRRHPTETSDPTLNRRAEQYVGRIFTLASPIVDGRGSLNVDDTVWRIEGENIAAGAKVQVVGAEGTVLKVDLEPEN